MKITVLQLLRDSTLTTIPVVDTRGEGSDCGSTILAQASAKEQYTGSGVGVVDANYTCVCVARYSIEVMLLNVTLYLLSPF